MKYFKTIIIFLVFSNFVFSQSPRELSVSLHFEKDTVFTFDPWHLQIGISNFGNDTVKIYPISIQQGRANHFGVIELEFMEDTDSIWRSTKQIVNMGKELGNFVYPSDLMVAFLPGQIVSSSFYLPPVLTSAKKLNIRASYLFNSLGLKIYSPIKTLFLKQYEGQDIYAFNYLTSLPRPDFIFHPLYAVQYELTDIPYAEYVTKNFPESRFASFANLFLSNVYRGLAMSEVKGGKIDLAIGNLRQSKLYGHKVLNNPDSRFWKKSEEILTQLNSILYQLYESDPSPDLVQEFLYPPKN